MGLESRQLILYNPIIKKYNPKKNINMATINSDVLVVGAGVSGLFAAWRLLNNDPSLKITIVDKLGRVGGRLQTTTVQIQGQDSNYYTVKDEEGGMRFVPESAGMPYLWKLLNYYTSQSIPRFNITNFPMGDDNNRYYVRGQGFTRATDASIWSTLYNLGPNEVNKTPSAILGEIMNDILAQNGNIPMPSNPSAWISFRNKCTYKDSTGIPRVLNQWGFWALIRQYGLTEECVVMLSHAIGFMGPFEEYINAAEGMQIIFDFPNPTAAFHTIDTGFQSLPISLYEDISNMNGNVIFNEEITAVQDNITSVVAYGRINTYTANKVIMAIPKETLKKIAQQSPSINENKIFMESLESVKDMELSKVDLYFNQRWWHGNQYQGLNLSSGGNFTDIPAGTVYSFAQYPDDPIADAAYTGPAALTIYTDFIRGNFWKEMQNIGEPYTTPAFPSNPPNTYAASTNLVNEAMRQIKMVFGLNPNDNTVPMPVLSAYRVWGEGQFGYGYHQYKLNVDDRGVYFGIIWPSKNIYVCNEAWSPEQGWVEGALMMSDLIVQFFFLLPPWQPNNNELFNLVKSKSNDSKNN
jgi:lysine 2-monooxygenase